VILSFDTITNLKLIFEFKRKVWEILRVTSFFPYIELPFFITFSLSQHTKKVAYIRQPFFTGEHYQGYLLPYSSSAIGFT